jgi:hypothetical protein
VLFHFAPRIYTYLPQGSVVEELIDVQDYQDYQEVFKENPSSHL